MLKPQMTPKELSRRPFRKWIDIISEKNKGESIAGNWTLIPNFQCYSKLMGMLMYVFPVHIRRGDYSKPGQDVNYWFTPISFYHSTIKMMIERLNSSQSSISFFVFSDDMNLVKEELIR